jgi:hypothetical protein
MYPAEETYRNVKRPCATALCAAPREHILQPPSGYGAPPALPARPVPRRSATVAGGWAGVPGGGSVALVPRERNGSGDINAPGEPLPRQHTLQHPRSQFVPCSSGGRGRPDSSGEPMAIVRLQTVSVLMCFKGESASSGRSFCICSSVLSFIQPWGTVA